MYPEGLPVLHVMVFSTMVAMLVYRREVSAQTRAFFEGMGFGFVHVISLIITASCLIAGMEATGLVKKLVSLVSGADVFAKLFSGVIPWALAVLSGSGTAPSVAFSKAVLPVAQRGRPERVDRHRSARRDRRDLRTHDVAGRGGRDLHLDAGRLHAASDREAHRAGAGDRLHPGAGGDGAAGVMTERALRSAPMPPRPPLLAALGPGVIWLALAQGSGELIWWPYIVAKYGLGFLCLLVPACLLQWPLNVEIGRYTRAHRRIGVAGISRG